MESPAKTIGHGSNMVRIMMWGGFAILLAAPWVAMRFTDEVDWTAGDFVVAGVLLASIGGAYEAVSRVSRHHSYRLGLGLALATLLFLIWSNLAVGLIGSEDNPANAVFLAVIGVALVGAMLARFQPRGMARTMVAAALVQLAIAVIALVVGWGFIFGLTALFMALWLGAAWLFHMVARETIDAA